MLLNGLEKVKFKREKTIIKRNVKDEAQHYILNATNKRLSLAIASLFISGMKSCRDGYKTEQV